METAKVALVVGVTGMAGLSIAEALKSPTALGGPWKVIGAARRPLPNWFPTSILDGFITFDATRYEDTLQKLSSVSNQVSHVFWVALQVRENEEANITVNTTMLANVVNVLKSADDQASPSPLTHITLQTGTKHYMGPIFDPTHSSQLIPHDPPFREDSHRLPYPNFYYALEDLVASCPPSVTYSVHRSSIIIGASSRSFFNALLTLSVYAVICKHEGLKFRFPGTRYTWEHFCDMSDARVLAEQQIWAAVTPVAKNQAFNCTNGDIFTWRSVWEVLCHVFGLEFVAFDETDVFDLVELMKERSRVWDHIVQKYGLEETKLEEITCAAALNHVLHFGFQHVCSMNKSREFGFFGHVDTLKSFGFWVERLRKMKILPP
ncbi:3-oxo-Delta(4,5)-steroid 5-beta-reductase [Ziziphus jujuba]|uniref:3-oxo-Delta(4,5)-steroid 5-beta-reductase n=2 Tax=Ziziphus jujuba TaxID=326968 RepID=A0A6P4BLG3_ZIZJJ|nr:3-oxo-Delta(4,5)-steroid 5-beta-reductase [Ziziphus jujuba]KAH7513441.1 hypothetical protein FEM48_Zijuj12G0200300 [Ziziphus jujuba var. spinosa]